MWTPSIKNLSQACQSALLLPDHVVKSSIPTPDDTPRHYSESGYPPVNKVYHPLSLKCEPKGGTYATLTINHAIPKPVSDNSCTYQGSQLESLLPAHDTRCLIQLSRVSLPCPAI